jgi:AcrR family transcriptional regulator
VATTLSRRDRVRAATVTEIKDTARRILVAEGPDGLSLRAIAREMGMTAPALYRYFPSREQLVEALIADLYDELTATLTAAGGITDGAPGDPAGGAAGGAAGDPVSRAARGAAGKAAIGTSDEALAASDPRAQITAASRAFRSWALAHPREFGLLFGSPIPGIDAHSDDSPAGLASERFGQLFGGLVARIYRTNPFPVPAEDEMDPQLRRQLRSWCSALPVELPIGAGQVFLSCWIRLYGMVAMEVFGHLQFALPDAEPMFEAELRDLAVKLGFGPAA